MTPAPLSQQEQADLNRLEQTVQQNIDSFWILAESLTEIRDRRLYRRHAQNGRPYTFDAYCIERWGFRESRGRQITDAFKVKVAVTDCNGFPSPTSEAQVRPLAGVPAPVSQAVWREASRETPGGRPPSGDRVKAALAKFASLSSAELAEKINASEAEAMELTITMKAKRAPKSEIELIRAGVRKASDAARDWAAAGLNDIAEDLDKLIQRAERRLTRMQSKE